MNFGAVLLDMIKCLKLNFRKGRVYLEKAIKRDYKKEYEKEKQTKVVKTIKLDKKLYNKLKIKLTRYNKNFTTLVIEKINEFLEG